MFGGRVCRGDCSLPRLRQLALGGFGAITSGHCSRLKAVAFRAPALLRSGRCALRVRGCGVRRLAETLRVVLERSDTFLSGAEEIE